MGLNIDELATLFTGREDYYTVDKSEEGVVFADANVQSGVVNGATLTLQDIAGLAELAAKDFNSESFAF